ncbi:MAG TPA: aminopeptidase [Myxococcota bacterium]|nr:aminopeptidase [Myxococcota bacterium]
MLAYLTHVGTGQLKLLWSRESLTAEKIAQLPPGERANYEAFRGALAFGESLGLRQTTSYSRLADTGKDWLVQVVTAAKPNALEPVTWWFPIVGSVTYRGYFDAKRAERFADELRGEGLDVYLRPSPLYSTLGWFEDPLPRPILRWPIEELVDTALHEQTHLTVYVASDVAYDESLATFIAHHATLQYFADRPELAEHASEAFADELVYARMLNELREELDALYAKKLTPDQAREQRTPIFARYQNEVYAAQPWKTNRFSRFPLLTLSNAWVVANRDYLGLVPCFEHELADLHGDLAAFVRAHRAKPGHRPEGCEDKS